MITPDALKAHARELGFDLCGIAPAASFPELARLPDWLAAGHAGEMTYLERSADVRSDIRHFLPTARSVIVTGTIYADGAAADPEPEPGEATVARYARCADYHRVLEERLHALVAWMRDVETAPFDTAVFVDKHPVQERVYAKYAGLGWLAKNTCVIHPDAGSWMLLAGVACSLPLAPDAPIEDLCGSCTICLDACPTGALTDARVMDATRCIAYLTIEAKGAIPEPLREAVGQHLYGCDICQEVCPYNFAPARSGARALLPDPAHTAPRATELYRKADHQLHHWVRGTSMLYTSVSRLRRNLAVVIGNGGDGEEGVAALDHPGGGVKGAAPAAEVPLVQEHVAWARDRLAARAGGPPDAAPSGGDPTAADRR